MRIDVVTIFPGYLAPLELSLVGKARDGGPLDLHVHDLRDWTSDPHRTVDDTPAGGGAGMVMKPDIWGLALDDVLARDVPGTATPEAPSDPAGQPRRVLAIPTPSGTPLTQRMVEDLAGAHQLVVACGRYEGIDARVAEHYRTRVETIEYSLGDYVLNGGEVAALALVEAVARLIPGVVGNPESLEEESHGAAGLLEYPVYTRPASWRGLDLPEVLLSGHHANIARWRRDRALERTAAVRPDMMAALQPGQLTAEDRPVLAHLGLAQTPDGLVRASVREGRPGDASALAGLAAATFPLACPPGLAESAIADFIEENLSEARFTEYLTSPERYIVLVGELDGAPGPAGYTLAVLPRTADEPPYAADVAAVVPERPAAELSKIYVRPEHHSSGLSQALMSATVEAVAGRAVDGEPIAVLWLGTNGGNRRAQRFYSRSGFTRVGGRRFVVGGREMNDAVWARPTLEAAPEPVAD